MFTLGVSINGFAQSENSAVKELVTKVSNNVNSASKGTVYGVIETTKEYYLINTPLGEYHIDRNKDGSFSFMGIKIKLISSNRNVYILESSLGKFKIDIKKGTITKL